LHVITTSDTTCAYDAVNIAICIKVMAVRPSVLETNIHKHVRNPVWAIAVPMICSVRQSGAPMARFVMRTVVPCKEEISTIGVVQVDSTVADPPNHGVVKSITVDILKRDKGPSVVTFYAGR